MRIGRTTVFLAVLFAACLSMAAAEEKYGVKVYDGATYDADTSQSLKSSMKLEAACYRTSAPIAQVIEFYKKQPAIKEVHTSPTSGMFKKGNVDVTIQSPYMDMKTHQRNKDTLITIVNQKP